MSKHGSKSENKTLIDDGTCVSCNLAAVQQTCFDRGHFKTLTLKYLYMVYVNDFAALSKIIVT